MCANWSESVTNEEAHRRAAGRRAINKKRQVLALRRQEIALNLSWSGLGPKQIARRLGVHVATVYRYLKFDHVKCNKTISYHYRRGWRIYGYR